MRNLLGNPFGGGVYPVNPKRRTVHGVHCYPDLAAVPEAIDLAVIATPAADRAALVARVRRARNVPAAIIISAGFSELGAEGRELEAQIRACPRQDADRRPQLPGHHPSTEQPQRQLRGRDGGAGSRRSLEPERRHLHVDPRLGRERHIGFSSFVSVGSMLDVDFADLIDYFGDDAATKAIILYMESIGDVRKFLAPPAASAALSR